MAQHVFLSKKFRKNLEVFLIFVRQREFFHAKNDFERRETNFVIGKNDFTEKQKKLKENYEKKLAKEAEEDKQHKEFLEKFFSDDDNSDIDTNNNWQIDRTNSSDSQGWNTTKLHALVYVANRYDLREGWVQ